MDLVCSPLAVLAAVLSVVLVNLVALGGKSHRTEGLQRLAVSFVLDFALFLTPRQSATFSPMVTNRRPMQPSTTGKR